MEAERIRGMAEQLIRENPWYGGAADSGESEGADY